MTLPKIIVAFHILITCHFIEEAFNLSHRSDLLLLYIFSIISIVSTGKLCQMLFILIVRSFYDIRISAAFKLAHGFHPSITCYVLLAQFFCAFSTFGLVPGSYNKNFKGMGTSKNPYTNGYTRLLIQGGKYHGFLQTRIEVTLNLM